jgi:RNA polymerase sigma-70 factor (sigma-E family)
MNEIGTTPSTHPAGFHPPEPSTAAVPVRLDGLDREAAIAALFEAHHLPLVRLAVLLGADDAEDVVAEAFYQLYRRWRRLRSPDAAAAYLRSVVVNLTRMRLRHLHVVRKHAARGDGRADHVASGEDRVVLRDDQQALVDAVRELPARQREALVLRFWLDLRESEIADAMGISAGSVKVHVSRGMAALSRRLEERR